MAIGLACIPERWHVAGLQRQVEGLVYGGGYAAHLLCAADASSWLVLEPRVSGWRWAQHAGGALKPSEDEILLGVARGDEESVRACIEVFGPFVQAIARSVLMDRSLIEDAAAEVFARVWTSAASFDPAKGPAKAWISVLARRSLIDLGRRERSRANTRAGFAAEVRALQGGPHSLGGPPGSGARASGGAWASESGGPVGASGGTGASMGGQGWTLLHDELATARRVMDGLPALDREALELAAARGWTHPRIAEHLDLPLGTVKTMIRRSLARVRDALSKDPAGGRGGDKHSAAATDVVGLKGRKGVSP